MMRRWMVLNGILAVIVLGFAVQIVRVWARALPPVEARAPGRATDAPARSAEGGKRGKRGQADKAPQTPATLVAAIVEKDLFDPSRSKPSEETRPVVAAVEVTPPPGISLVGIRMFGKDREGFILDATQGNAQRRIRLGDTVGDFTVKAIRSSSVVLVAGTGEYVTLTLALDKSKGGATPPPVRPGRAQAAAAPGAVPSPAAGVTAGGSPAAGVGGAKPPVVAAGTAATAPPPIPGQPAPTTTTLPQAKVPPISPNLPEGVRQKLEQMRQRR